MTEVLKYSAEVLGWQRKPGPVQVWRVVDVRNKTQDGKIQRFSIQEIPEDRQTDVMNFMMRIFVRDEATCRSIGAVNDPEALEDFRKLWSFALGQGIAVGAFLIDENNPKPILAGVNLTMIHSEVTFKGFTSEIHFNSRMMQQIFQVIHQLDEDNDTKRKYNVDKYISAFGLCVDPQFRGQGLAKQLLQARKEMSVAYNIQATSTVFTSETSQHVAAQVGFEVLAEREYASFINENGSEYFPGIDSKSCKLMGMHF